MYRIGIVGAGNISDLHFEGIRRHPARAQVVAICDPDRESREKRAANFGNVQAYTDLAAMICESAIDVAVVCTPTHIRREAIRPLIQAKIPVLCEKPLAETYAEAAEIEGIAREAGVRVAVNQNFRRHFAFALAKEKLSEGVIGRPLHLVQCSMALRRDIGWRTKRSRYIMAVMTIHWLDGYRYMLGEEPETVYCRGVNSPAIDGGEDTAVSVTLTFPRGTVASLSESFSSFANRGTCTLDCDGGTLALDYGKLTAIHADGRSVERPNPFDKAEATWYLLDELLKAVEEGREPETSASDNLKSMRILEAAFRSMEDGRVVRLEELP